MNEMGLTEYENALRLGKKRYQQTIGKEETPYLIALDEIIKEVEIVSEVNLGIITIPLENIVGTKTAGRTFAFANNFMPLLDEKSEFCVKWCNVFNYQMERGIKQDAQLLVRL